MLYLLTVSLIWAFSFGIIKDNLAGLNSSFVASVRLLLSFLVFLPFLKTKNIPLSARLKLFLTGAVQYGIMYVSYISAYKYLLSYEIALLTIFTPLYVTAFGDLFRKKFNPLFFITASVSVVGAGIVLYQTLSPKDLLIGFLLMQLSNLCFAFGQIYYKRIMSELKGLKDAEVFSFLYLGGFVTALLFVAPQFRLDYFSLNSNQILSLIYLGIVASGLGFFLWNYGARKVNDGTLGIFNNIKIPLAIAVSLIFFGERADLLRLTLGLIVITLAIILNENKKVAKIFNK